MHPDSIDLAELGQLLRQVAREEILTRRARPEIAHKGDGSLVTDADHAIQTRLIEVLQPHYPDIPLLGEEMPATQQRQLLQSQAAGLWVLDPLDGTTNFAAGLPLCVSSLALLHGGEIVLGLIYDPFQDELFMARRGQGAWLNGKPLRLESHATLLNEGIGLIDGKRLSPALACALASQSPFRSQRSLGSVALEWCQMAAGRALAYLHGRQSLWDYAAGILIFAEAGGCSATLEGDSLFELSLTPRSALAAPSAELLETWQAWLASHN